MTVDRWLRAALADAESRGRPELAPLLQTLAQVTRTLRGADVLRQEPVPPNPAAGDAPMRPTVPDGE
jgi:hypothetical protein